MTTSQSPENTEKLPVTDAAVQIYATSIRNGGPIARAFNGPLKECDFTKAQRQHIAEARRARKAINKQRKASSLAEPPIVIQFAQPVLSAKEQESKQALTKLGRILFLQHGCCFFCRQPLSENEASIEHLLAKKWGGKSEEWNEVVCHRTLNTTFGAMDLRSKFAFVVNTAGKLRCPN